MVDPFCLYFKYIFQNVPVAGVSARVLPTYGRGGCNRSSQNPGIAKKGGGGGLTTAKIFFGDFDLVHRGQLKVKIDP